MRDAFVVSPEDVRLHERIAVGGFAEVFKGTWQGTVVAVKQLLERTKEVQGKLEQEVEVLAKLRHPNLLLFMGYCADPPLICTEFMRRGSLHTILKSGQALEPTRNYAVATAVARGMSYLHSRSPPILHLDLKSPNILVDDKWRVKIADFGLARVRQSTQVSAKSEFHGTPEWMAPEMLRAENYDERADTYSFGVVLWELLTARTPWAELHPMQVVAVVGYSGRALELPDDVPNGTHVITQLLSKLFHACAALNRDDRPMFPVVLAELERAKAALAARVDAPKAAQKPPKRASPVKTSTADVDIDAKLARDVDALGVNLEFVSLAEPNEHSRR
jgi:serine/threonine protein kinase